MTSVETFQVASEAEASVPKMKICENFFFAYFIGQINSNNFKILAH